MHVIDGALIVIAVLSFILSVFVLLKNRKNIVNFSFALFIMNAAIWPLTIAFFRMSQDVTSALLWDRMIYISGTIVPASFLFFTHAFIDKKPLTKKQKFFYIGIPLLLIIFLFTGDLWIKQIIILPSGKQVSLGPIYLLWMLYFGIFMGWGTLKLWKKYKSSIGLEKAQTRYILLAVLFPIIGALPFNLLFPLFGNYQLIFVGPFFLTVMIAIISYAIIRYRLFDLRFALQQLFAYVVLTTIIAIFFSITAVVYASINNALLPAEVFGFIILVAAILVLIFGEFQSLVEYFSAKYFFHSLYDYQKTLRNLSSRLSTYLEMPKLADVFTNTLMETMSLRQITILVRDFADNCYKIQKNIGFNKENGIALVRDNFLTSYLEKNPHIIVLDEIKKIAIESKSKYEQESLERLVNHMKNIEAELIIPIVNVGKLISLIVLGSKKSGDPYTVQDINLLETIASQASIALENARLYKEVQNFNKNLEQKVKEATKELEQSNKMLKQANIKIGLADKVKNDLLTMASHEFRTPTTIINNALWFLDKKEVFDKLGDKESQNLKKIIETMERLNYVVKNMNQMLITTSGDLEIEVTPTQVEILIQEVVEDKNTEAREKQIALAYQEPKELLPEIPADKVKLKYVLWELITNALKYTKKEGRIIISASVKNKNLEIKIKDTGVGIPAEALPHIFEGFKKIDLFHKTQSGMGLGLYVVKKIVDLHKGKINIKSEAGRGTVVEIYLPVKDLSEIKTKNFSQDEEVANYHQRQESFADYSNIKENKLPHYLHIIKYLAAFQTASAFFRVY